MIDPHEEWQTRRYGTHSRDAMVQARIAAEIAEEAETEEERLAQATLSLAWSTLAQVLIQEVSRD